LLETFAVTKPELFDKLLDDEKLDAYPKIKALLSPKTYAAVEKRHENRLISQHVELMKVLPVSAVSGEVASYLMSGLFSERKMRKKTEEGSSKKRSKSVGSSRNN